MSEKSESMFSKFQNLDAASFTSLALVALFWILKKKHTLKSFHLTLYLFQERNVHWKEIHKQCFSPMKRINFDPKFGPMEEEVEVEKMPIV